MKRWLGPSLFGLIIGILSWYAGLALATFGLMEAALHRIAGAEGFNQMRHSALPTPQNQPIVRPSPDLAYSSCPYDLSAGPLLISIVPVPGRYSSLSVFDARTDVVFVRNDKQANEKPYQIVLARAGQAVPANLEVVRVGYDRGVAIIRLLLNTPTEIGGLGPMRTQSSCRPLRG